MNNEHHFVMSAAEAHTEQLRLPFGPSPKRGVSFLRHGARRYAQRRGRTYDPTGLDEMQADSGFQTKVAQKYTAMAVVPDKRIERAYAALKAETHEQYDYLTRPRTEGGLGITVELHPELDNTKLYANADEMAHDIRTNRRLKVNQTGSNPADQAVGHPFLDPETNDKFRAVHDAFGHAAIGRSFSRHGEEAAYHSHMQMFSTKALPALVAETRAQNSALNFGSGEGFPEQKPIMLPPWTMKDRRPRPTTRPAGPSGTTKIT